MRVSACSPTASPTPASLSSRAGACSTSPIGVAVDRPKKATAARTAGILNSILNEMRVTLELEIKR